MMRQSSARRRVVSRRTLLRGAGVAVAVPWLEAMRPRAAGAATDAAVMPNRLAFVYVPNGQVMEHWTPKTEGAEFELPPILAPLRSVQDELLILSGLTTHPGSNGDGGHARAMGGFLTGTLINKSEGADMRAGISVDQVAAQRVGDRTRVPSLQIGCERGAMAGNCDNGFSCVYTSSMSWRSATQPLPKEVDPALVFDRLFGAIAPRERARMRSVLDFVRDDSRDLDRRLGAGDRRKLDQYFTAVRDVELQLARMERMPEEATPTGNRPAGVPADYQEHIRLMCDLLVLAFQADVTRICTFMLANELSNRPFPFLGIADGHHDLSHANDKVKLQAIDVFFTTQLAYLLDKLRAVPEGDGTVLDHAMIVYGSGLSDGNRHNYDNLPMLVAGKGCGGLQPGRHVRYPTATPLSNLWVALLDRMGAGVPTHGDSTGRLPGLAG